MSEFNALSIVCPVYNEEEVLKDSYKLLKEYISSDLSRFTVDIILVNDGSKDGSEKIINDLCDKDSSVKLISFSRNFGQQAAITAGLRYAKGDYVCIMDVDMQDHPKHIKTMIEKLERENLDMVYVKRIEREGETAFKKFTSKAFYRIFNCLSDIKIPLDTGEFRLMKQCVVKEINKLKENPIFLRGIYCYVGFKQDYITVTREKRLAGETKFTLKSMINLSKSGLISFSKKILNIPLIASIISFILFLIALFIGLSPIFLLVVNYILLFLSLSVVAEFIKYSIDLQRNRPQYIIKYVLNIE